MECTGSTAIKLAHLFSSHITDKTSTCKEVAWPLMHIYEIAEKSPLTVLKITIPVSFGKNRTNVTRMSVLIRPTTLT
jgi:hypothetical protein